MPRRVRRPKMPELTARQRAFRLVPSWEPALAPSEFRGIAEGILARETLLHSLFEAGRKSRPGWLRRPATFALELAKARAKTATLNRLIANEQAVRELVSGLEAGSRAMFYGYAQKIYSGSLSEVPIDLKHKVAESVLLTFHEKTPFWHLSFLEHPVFTLALIERYSRETNNRLRSVLKNALLKERGLGSKIDSIAEEIVSERKTAQEAMSAALQAVEDYGIRKGRRFEELLYLGELVFRYLHLETEAGKKPEERAKGPSFLAGSAAIREARRTRDVLSRFRRWEDFVNHIVARAETISEEEIAELSGVGKGVFQISQLAEGMEGLERRAEAQRSAGDESGFAETLAELERRRRALQRSASGLFPGRAEARRALRERALARQTAKREEQVSSFGRQTVSSAQTLVGDLLRGQRERIGRTPTPEDVSGLDAALESAARRFVESESARVGLQLSREEEFGIVGALVKSARRELGREVERAKRTARGAEKRAEKGAARGRRRSAKETKIEAETSNALRELEDAVGSGDYAKARRLMQRYGARFSKMYAERFDALRARVAAEAEQAGAVGPAALREREMRRAARLRKLARAKRRGPITGVGMLEALHEEEERRRALETALAKLPPLPTPRAVPERRRLREIVGEEEERAMETVARKREFGRELTGRLPSAFVENQIIPLRVAKRLTSKNLEALMRDKAALAQKAQEFVRKESERAKIALPENDISRLAKDLLSVSEGWFRRRLTALKGEESEAEEAGRVRKQAAARLARTLMQKGGEEWGVPKEFTAAVETLVAAESPERERNALSVLTKRYSAVMDLFDEQERTAAPEARTRYQNAKKAVTDELSKRIDLGLDEHGRKIILIPTAEFRARPSDYLWAVAQNVITLREHLEKVPKDRLSDAKRLEAELLRDLRENRATAVAVVRNEIDSIVRGIVNAPAEEQPHLEAERRALARLLKEIELTVL